jgi:hypothetical protein
MDRLNRSSNNINVASFWENFQLKKYNFDPAYQRRGDVWLDNKKSFLIDTIFKNFPMPPIFLHQHIDDKTGKTIYDVIDGKQRLQSIVDFINNKIPLPKNFSEDYFGDEKLNGFYFKDLDRPDFIEIKKSFWRYSISIEYVDSDEESIIDNIFDRLNRNGEPLNPQELRKAKYHDTSFYKLIEKLNNNSFWKENLNKLNINRFDDIEFVSELLLVILNDSINDASTRDKLDILYDKYCTKEKIKEIEEQEIMLITSFNEITDIVRNFNLDLSKYNINSVSHLYGLWGLAWIINKIKDNKNYSDKLNKFYSILRANNTSNENVKQYKESMQAATKSKSYRIKRINALLNFCDIDYKITI